MWNDMTKNCVICGREFRARGPKKTCSTPCVIKKDLAWKMRKRRSSNPIIRDVKCSVCGKAFQVEYGTGWSNKRICGDICVAKNRRAICLRFSHSEKGKSYSKAWGQSQIGKASLKASRDLYRTSKKGIEFFKRYQESAASKEYKRQYQQRRSTPSLATINFLLTLNLSQSLNKKENSSKGQ